MRVLHVIDSGGLYGAENMLLDLATEQAEMGHRPAIASIGESGGEKAIEREAAARGIRVERFRMRPGPNVAGALRILSFADRESMHLIHSHGYKGNILLGTIPRRWRRRPLLATLHGYTSLERLTRMKMYEWLDAHLLRLLDAVVLVDPALKLHPRLRNCAPTGCRVIGNGIRLRPSPGVPPDPAVVDFCRGGFTIGAIGRLSPEKGFADLIAAFGNLVRGGEDLRLVIIGEGAEREELQARIDTLNLKTRVLLAGYRPAARDYLPLLGAFVLPSHTEGLPITLLEAMHAGVPIVATRVGGIPNVLEEGRAGLLVPPGSVADLARGILALRERPALGRELVARARQRVVGYSSRRMATQYENIYRELLTAGSLADA